MHTALGIGVGLVLLAGWEAPVFPLVFGVPGLVALLLRWRLH